MTADRDLQNDVLRAFDRDLRLSPARIGVIVNRGIVTLAGTVDTLQERLTAERTALSVSHVRAVVNELEVCGHQATARTNATIADEVSSALSWTTAVPLGAVIPTVSHGWVTLVGTVDCDEQRVAAERAARQIAGVRGVFNAIDDLAIGQPHVM